MKQIKNEPHLWPGHPDGPPDPQTIAVYEGAGQRFAIARNNRFTDRRILTLTRHYTWGELDRLPASAGLALLRRALKRHFPWARAIETYAYLPHHEAFYEADGWVWVSNKKGHKRYIHTL